MVASVPMRSLAELPPRQLPLHPTLPPPAPPTLLPHFSPVQICFVGDDAFRELSQVDEAAPQLLGQAIAKDGSKAWFQERCKRHKTGDTGAQGKGGKGQEPVKAVGQEHGGKGGADGGKCTSS